MSRHGVVTGSYWHDTPGPLTRSIKDSAILLDIMAGPDRYDNLTFEAVGHIPAGGYVDEVTDKGGLKGMKLGLPWDPYWSTNAVRNIDSARQNSIWPGSSTNSTPRTAHQQPRPS